MRAALLTICCLSTVMTCSILSVHLTDFKDQRDSDFRAHPMSLNGCISTMDIEPTACNVASSNVVTRGTDFPLLLLIVDLSEKRPLQFLFTVTDNDTLIEYYSLSNLTLQDLIEPNSISVRYREADHFTGNFRFRLYEKANCRDEAHVYISAALTYANCDNFCYFTIGLAGTIFLVIICCVLGSCCYCLCCRKRQRKNLSHPYDITPEQFPHSDSSSVSRYRKPSISSPIEAISSIEQDMSTFTPLSSALPSVSTPCTPV